MHNLNLVLNEGLVWELEGKNLYYDFNIGSVVKLPHCYLVSLDDLKLNMLHV